MWKILSGVSALFLLLAAIFSYLNHKDYRTELTLLDHARTNLASVEGHKGTADKKLADTKVELAQVQSERDTSQKQLAEAKASFDELNTTLKGREDTLAIKTDEVAALETELDKIGSLEAVTDQLSRLETQIVEYDEQIASLKNLQAVTLDTKQLTEKTIEDYKTLVSNQQAGRMPQLSARVSQVYGTWGFVVFEAGNRSGVVKDATLDVVRGGSTIGQVVVAQVEPGRSVANIVRNSFSEGSLPQVGDTLRVAAESLAAPRS